MKNYEIKQAFKNLPDAGLPDNDTVTCREYEQCYMDFEKYGADCMENDYVIETGFGRLRRLDPPFPEQTQGQQMFQ